MTITTEQTVLPQLANPRDYVACTWNLAVEPQRRAYWLGLFREHFPGLLDRAVEVAVQESRDRDDARRCADAAGNEFFAYLTDLASNPDPAGTRRLDILDICIHREGVLRRHGFDDPYRLAKQDENNLALKLLPGVLEELDALEPGIRRQTIIRGIFAGNIFDLGAVATDAIFRNGQSIDFRHVRGQLKDRPWLIDDLDPWLERWSATSYRAALLFVDNAGPDVLLGMLPFARELVRDGARVLLAANSTPTLNDVTADELSLLLESARTVDAVIDEALDAGRLAVAANGNGMPLIDLTRLAPAFIDRVVAEPIDLVVLEGMGRALESNLNARLTCDTLKLAMIKDQGVADALDGTLYDLVLRFERGR